MDLQWKVKAMPRRETATVDQRHQERGSGMGWHRWCRSRNRYTAVALSKPDSSSQLTGVFLTTHDDRPRPASLSMYRPSRLYFRYDNLPMLELSHLVHTSYGLDWQPG